MRHRKGQCEQRHTRGTDRARIDACLADPDRRHTAFVNREEYLTDVYNMPVFVYEDLYLGLPSLFHRSGFWPDRKNQDGIIQPVLASSRDLCAWNRLNHEVFIPHSPRSATGVCDQAIIMAAPPARHGDELWFCYRGGRYSHIGHHRVAQVREPGERLAAIHLARLRLDGFASIRADATTGSVLTNPVTIDGDRLFVNAAAQGGEIRVGLLDAITGDAIPEFSTDSSVPIHDDRVDRPVRWSMRDDLGTLRGKTVRVIFTISNADLLNLSRNLQFGKI